MKKIFVMLLSLVIMLLMCCPAFAANNQPTISVGNVSGEVGDTVSVDISVSNNPGIIALKLKLQYDTEYLSLKSVQDAGLMGSKNYTFGNNITAVPFVLWWEDGLSSENYTADGTLATLTFEIISSPANNKAEISISLDSGSTFNYDLDDVAFDTKSGFVTIGSDDPQPPIIENPTIKIESKSAAVGSTVEVPIMILNNPGIIAIKMRIQYNTDYLRLINAHDEGLLGAGNSLFSNNISAVPYALSWEDGLAADNYTNDGIVATLTFEVLSVPANGKTEIAVSLDNSSTFNYNLDDVSFETLNGTVTINEFSEQPYLTSKENSTTIIDDTFVYGLQPGITENIFEGQYIKVEGNGHIEYNGSFGTGTIVNLINDKTDELFSTYTIIIFGDVDGDGVYDGQDAFIVNCIANGLLTKEQVGEAKWMAADCNHVGEVNSSDVILLEQAGLLLSEVDQTASQEELMETQAYRDYLDLIDQTPNAQETPVDELIKHESKIQTVLNKIIAFIKNVIDFISSFAENSLCRVNK